MKLRKLWIQEYNKYHNCVIDFDDNAEITSFQRDIFGQMNITLFSGENGAGKTTILSFIAIIFRYLQRFRERIPSDFCLQYTITVFKNEYEIELSFVNRKLFIQINGESYYVKNFCLKKKQYVGDMNIVGYEQVTYDDIKKYLPKQIIVIGFDAAYQTICYGGRYIGDRLVEYRGLGASYGTTGRGNDYSMGVLNSVC